MSLSTGWQPILLSIEEQHSHLKYLRLCEAEQIRSSKERPESLPGFLKIAVAIAAQSGLASNAKPLRLAIIAPRWEEGAFWMAVGAALCSIKKDFEHAKGHLPEFEQGEKLLLDGDKVVQFEGKFEGKLKLKVAGDNNFLSRPDTVSLRLRLQPTTTRRPLSPLPGIGEAPPDLLDELLEIQSQGARHIFSTRVVLISPVTKSRETARYINVSFDDKNSREPLRLAQCRQILAKIRRVKGSMGRQMSEDDPLWKLLLSAEHIASKDEIASKDRDELAQILQKTARLARVRASSEVHQQCALLEEVEQLVQPRRRSSAPAQQLLNLFQWGTLAPDGTPEIESAGQVAAAPVLLLTHELLALRNFLRAGKTGETKPLVVLDGSGSFRHRLNDLNQLLDSQTPVLACLERGQSEDAATLKERGFEVWKWLPDDLNAPRDVTEAPLFGTLLRAHGNYARHRLHERVCADEPIETASQGLMELLGDLDSGAGHTKILESALYASLLCVARQLHRSDAANMLARERLAGAHDVIARDAQWLDDETRERAGAVLEHLERAIGADGNGKTDGLREMVAASSAETIAVVVAHARNIEAARAAWKKVGDGDALLREKTVSFCCPLTAEAHLDSTRAGHLIICGWLGAHHMRRLLDGCLAADISILLYPFERGWLRGALRRWRGDATNLSAHRRLTLMGVSHADLKIHLDETGREPLADLMDAMPPEEKRASEFDAGGYEARLSFHHRARLAAGTPGEATEAARLFDFSGEHFAFLTESCRLPVVSDLIAQAREPDATRSKASGRSKELPQKRADELQAGDFVVFRRGAAGDLLREMADIRLKRTGAGALRELAGTWKQALVAWAKNKSLREATMQLRAAGVERGEQTVRYWLDEDNRTIGPRDPESTLTAIARVTGDERLNRDLPAVLDAIHRVHSAHLSASDELKHALHARLPAHIARADADVFARGSLSVEIAGVGEAVVVRVEAIADQTISVARSQINVLQRQSADAMTSTEFEMGD